MLSAKVKDKEFSVRLWHHGDPWPPFGDSVGVDTETSRIDETEATPLLAYVGIYNDADATCYIADHRDGIELMLYLSLLKTTQFYFNIGFDFFVLDKAALGTLTTLWQAVEYGRVVDVGVRAALHAIATIGEIPDYSVSLKKLTKHCLGYVMDKGEEKGELSDRLTFSPGKQITDSQQIYLGIDAYCTWSDATKIPKQSTEATHTRGAILLYDLHANGFPVDMRIWEYYKSVLRNKMECARKRLIACGYPDPEFVKQKDPSGNLEAELRRLTADIISSQHAAQVADMVFSKTQLRQMLLYLAYVEKDNYGTCLSLIMSARKSTLSKKEKNLWEKLVAQYDIGMFDNSSKRCVLLLLAVCVVRSLMDGCTFSTAMEKADDVMQEHEEWFTERSSSVGPKKFLQEHLKALVLAHPKLLLQRTKKARDLKLTKEDKWRLEDLGIEDDFLDAYMEYYHIRKYLSTYLNDAYIRTDNRVHPRYSNLVRTGRTASSSPNIQNLPSKDKEFPLKNCYQAPEGAILCSTDYGFIELVCFAQSCYTRFGFSTMRDIINAELDPHRWFAGVKKGLIDADTSKLTDPMFVKKLAKYLEEHVTKVERNNAKAPNFGFPGGMGPQRFYEKCRSDGMRLTMEDAEQLHREWRAAFLEMSKHMCTAPAKPVSSEESLYYRPISSEDGTEDLQAEDSPAEDAYSVSSSATLINGMVRNRCSPNSARNIQFQGLAAAGAKEAGWELLKLGLAPRLLCFVHDEFLYWLWPQEVFTMIPKIEAAMIRGMHKMVPDVRVTVESACMLHWDKGATPFTELKKDCDGLPVVRDSEEIVNILKACS